MSQDRPPRRREAWWVSFDPSIGGEIRQTRPAVIVRNNVAGRELNRLQVGRLYPSEAYVRVNGAPRKAMPDQLSTISKRRLRQRIGKIDPADVAAVERAIRLQFGL